jgi:hypothetical protein
MQTNRGGLHVGTAGAVALVVLGLAGCASDDGVNASNSDPNGTGGTAGSGGAGAGAGGTPPTLQPSVSVLDAHATLGEQKAEVAVVLSVAASVPVSVTFDTVDGSATESAGDYQAVHQTLTFAPGQTKLVVSIPVKTPYAKLGLETALSRELATKLSAPTGGVAIADGDGRVTLAHAGMVIETEIAQKLFDAEIIPDFNGDQKADLWLSGNAARAMVLLTPGTVFEEAGHVVANETWLDGERGFSYPVSTADKYEGPGFVTGDDSASWDANQDGFSDLLVVSDSRARILYGHAGPFVSFASGDPRLANGTDASELADIYWGHGGGALETGDWNGDGIRDFAQSTTYSSLEGGVDSFNGYYGVAGGYPAVYSAKPSFSFVSGTAVVGLSTLSNGTRSGVSGDLDGDDIDDLTFVGISANDGMFGGCYLYVRFGENVQLSEQKVLLKGNLNGDDGFFVSHDEYLSTYSLWVPEDMGDVNGDGIDDLIVTGGGKALTAIFGQKTPYSKGGYTNLSELGTAAAIFDTDTVIGARTGDLNRDGTEDIVFITENKLRVVWGKQGLTGKPIYGTQYPEVGELDIDPESGLDDVSVVSDLDGDGTDDVVILSDSWHGSGGALILFGSTLTRMFGGPNLELPEIK